MVDCSQLDEILDEEGNHEAEQDMVVSHLRRQEKRKDQYQIPEEMVDLVLDHKRDLLGPRLMGSGSIGIKHSTVVVQMASVRFRLTV